MVFKLFTSLILFIEPKNTIKHADIPSCKHCKYYMPSDFLSYPELAECKKFKYFDQRTGHHEFPYAKTCRSKEFMCGREGKSFVFNKNLEKGLSKNKA